MLNYDHDAPPRILFMLLIQEILSLTGHKYTLEFGRKKAYVTRLSNHKVFMIW
jgi:hypothetical protein